MYTAAFLVEGCQSRDTLPDGALAIDSTESELKLLSLHSEDGSGSAAKMMQRVVSGLSIVATLGARVEQLLTQLQPTMGTCKDFVPVTPHIPSTLEYRLGEPQVFVSRDDLSRSHRLWTDEC